MAHSNEIQLCLILLKQPQLLHFFLHKNNGIPDVKGGRRETAEESYIFSVIIEALIHVSDGTGFQDVYKRQGQEQLVQSDGHWLHFRVEEMYRTEIVESVCLW